MVRRSSTTSSGTTYWFQCFCVLISRLLRMHNFSDLMCLPKTKSEKDNKAMKKRTSLSLSKGSGQVSCVFSFILLLISWLQ